jgi:hypothetical protein
MTALTTQTETSHLQPVQRHVGGSTRPEAGAMMRQPGRPATRRVLTLVLLAVGVVAMMTADQAAARPAAATNTAAQASVSQTPTCLIHSLPSFMAQGEFANAATVADVVEVECNPVIYGTGAEVTVTAAQLYSRCHEVSWYIPNENGAFREARGSSVSLHLDVNGNANVGLIAGPHCMPGESLITLDQDEAPYETFTTSFEVLPTKNTPQGLSASPASQVEDAESSGVVTVIQTEFNEAAEAKVRLGAAQLYHRCQRGPHLLWVRENREVVPGPELAGEHAVELDNNGNGFALAIGTDSCAQGPSLIEGDLEASPYTTTTTEFTVLPPQPTAEPAFTISKSQEIRGSGGGFTTSPLTGAIGQTVDYQIVVKNTGTVAETFSEFTDGHCDTGTLGGGPGSSALAPGESTTYTCDHVLTVVGSYTNEATVTGNTAGGIPLRQTSNQVVVTVPAAPAFTIEKLQKIMGTATGFTSSPLTGAIGQKVEYEIVVKNTGNEALKFSSFADAKCDTGTIAGGPGETPLAPGASATYTCSYLLTSVGTYTNEASVSGTPAGGEPITHKSNVVEVVVLGPSGAFFVTEKLQRIKGSSGEFTTAPLTGSIGETIEYEIIVRNTGKVPLSFSNFTDPHCDSGTISGGPGGEPVAPGASTSYTCTRVLTAVGSYENEATVTGTATGEPPLTLTSNTVLASVPAASPSPSPSPPAVPAVAPSPPAKGVLAISQCEVKPPVLYGASGPKRGTFTVQISSAEIKQITFYLDGHKLKSLKQSQARGGKFTIKINPRNLSYGPHRLSVRATMISPSCASVARSGVFVRPHTARVVVKFTG